MHGAVSGDNAGLVVEARVDLRKIAQRDHHCANQQRQHGQAATRFGPAPVQLRAQFFQLGDVDFLDIAEMRNAPLGLLHLAGDHAAQADHRHCGLVNTFDIPRA